MILALVGKWNGRFERIDMSKKKNLEKRYDVVKRNIDFSHVRKHQRSIPKRKKFEGIRKWVEIQININIKKRETKIEEIENRGEKKKKEIEDLKREKYAQM